MPRCVINAGHGNNTFDEHGAKGLYYQEDGQTKKFEEHDDFNAHIAQIVARRLKEHGIEVLMPQTPWGKDVPLQTRTKEANEWGADVYWSIHANYNSDPNASGACGWSWYSAEDSKNLSQAWAQNMKRAGYNLHGSGLHLADTNPDTWEPALWELYKTNMTAVIAEHGFFGNPEERQELLSDAHRHKMAEVSVKTLVEHFGMEYKPNEAKAPEQEADEPKSDYVGHWAETSIKKAMDKGIINGHSDGTFRPDQPVTRAQLSVILDRLGHLD